MKKARRSGLMVTKKLINGIRQQGHDPGALDRHGKLPLVLGAGAGHAAGQYFAALRNEAAQAGYIFEIYIRGLIHTEAAGLLTAGHSPLFEIIFAHLVYHPPN